MLRPLFHSVPNWPTWAAGAVFLAAPFEGLRPAVSLPGQDLSSVELVFVLAVAGWAAARMAAGRAPRWGSPLTVPAASLVAALAASALLSAEFEAAAWLFTCRQAAGLLFFLLILDAADSATRLRRLLACACLAGTVSAGLGIAESFGAPGAAALLETFRLQTYTVGLLNRTSATLQYPTIAAMYLEIVFAFSLGLLLENRGRTSPAAAISAWIAATATGVCLVLTLTRAGWIVAAALLGLAALALGPWPASRGSRRRIAVLSVLLGAMWCALAAVNSSFLLRLTSHPTEWFRAEYEAPAALEMRSGRSERVAIRVRNAGRVPWDPASQPELRLAYHWFTSDGSLTVIWEGARTPLPGAVPVGGAIDVSADVVPPEEPGTYLLAWDMLAENRFWFSLEGSASARTRVVVTGAASGEPLRPTASPSSRFLVPRSELWAIGLRLFLEHPWLGIGADNFRLVYGRRLGLETYDLTYHAHNLAIEILATAGLAGGLALVWLGWRLSGTLRRGLGSRNPRLRSLFLGLSLAAAAILLHGMVDYFLEFTPTYLMMWGVLGLTAAADRLERSGADANRV